MKYLDMTKERQDLLEEATKPKNVHNVRLMWGWPSAAVVGDDVAMCDCCLNDRSSSRCFHIGHGVGDHNCYFSLAMSNSPKIQCSPSWAP